MFANHVRYDSQDRHFKILCLVGNGFDMQLLSHYKSSPKTSYTDFYHFLKMRGHGGENLILRHMEELIEDGKKDWSDVERVLSDLGEGGHDYLDISRSLTVVQIEFSAFLNLVVNDTLLGRLDSDAKSNKWAMRSLSEFLRDLETLESLKKIPFGARKANRDLYDFLFVNFNYTSLLDNYIYTDQSQFDPFKYRSSGSNFEINTDPNDHTGDTTWNYNSYSFLTTRVVHPHGYQDIPRSLLFGVGPTDGQEQQLNRLQKTYWTQAKRHYEPMVSEADLYIIFGCSLGESDSWWWSTIARKVLQSTDSAIILYRRLKARDADSTNELFSDFARAASVTSQEEIDRLRSRTCVVPYTDADPRVWLSTRPAEGAVL